jgi:hypothetical protein
LAHWSSCTEVVAEATILPTKKMEKIESNNAVASCFRVGWNIATSDSRVPAARVLGAARRTM